MEKYTECQPLLVSREFSLDYYYPYIGTLLNWPVVWTEYDKPLYSRFLTNRNAWAVAWWSSTQKPIKSPGAIWIVFWVCPVKRPQPRQGSCWQLEVVPWRKKRNLVCSTRTALCHKIGIDLDLNRMHGTLAPKRKEAVPLLCTVAHCTVRAILYTKNFQDEKTKIKKKMWRFHFNSYPQEKENVKTNMSSPDNRLLLELTAIGILTDDLVF